MAQVFVTDLTDIDTFIYGKQHAGTLDYLKERAQAVTEWVSTGASRFATRVKEMYEEMEFGDTWAQAKAARRRFGMVDKMQDIRYLNGVTEIQQAPYRMRPYIMAHPGLRRLFHQQMCDGYSDTYVDRDPGMVGEDHLSWRNLHHGLVQEVVDEETGETDLKVSYFFDDVQPDEELTLDDVDDILSTHDWITWAIKERVFDPSNDEGGRF